MYHSIPRRACVLLTIALASPLVRAQTNHVTIPCDADTTLYEDASGNVANGGGQSLFVGRTGTNTLGELRRGLLRFDVAAAIPPGAKILSAQLKLFVAQAADTQPVGATAHRVLEGWSEGAVVAPGNGGQGGPAAAGESTWLHTNYPNASWSTAGGSFAPAPSVAFDLPIVGFVTTTAQPGLAADVQDMLDQPAANHGWLLKTDELQIGTARRVRSREGVLFAPELQVSWVALGATGTYGVGTQTASGNCAVTVQGPAAGGASLTATYASLPPLSLGANFFSIAIDPIGIPLGTTGRVYLPANPLVPGPVFATDAAGTASASIPLPGNFPGLMLTMQAAVLDQSALGFALTNAAVMVVQ